MPLLAFSVKGLHVCAIFEHVTLPFCFIGNIRVYCRIRPFLPGQVAKQTAVEYIGENGELAVVNPSKQVKDRRRNFKFNKVFGPDSTQGFQLHILFNLDYCSCACTICWHGCNMLSALDIDRGSIFRHSTIDTICAGWI